MQTPNSPKAPPNFHKNLHPSHNHLSHRVFFFIDSKNKIKKILKWKISIFWFSLSVWVFYFPCIIKWLCKNVCLWNKFSFFSLLLMFCNANLSCPIRNDWLEIVWVFPDNYWIISKNIPVDIDAQCLMDPDEFIYLICLKCWKLN